MLGFSQACVSIPKYDSYRQSYVDNIDSINGTLALSTTEFNFFTIKPLTDSRGKTGTFDSSITNVWGPARQLQIKMGLKKRLSKKTKSKNVKQIEKDEFIIERRKVLLRFVLKRNYKVPSFIFFIQ